MLKAFKYRRAVTISTTAQQGQRGKYHVFAVQAADDLTPEQQRQFAALARQYAGVKLTTDVEAHEAADNGGGRVDDDVPF